MTEARNFNGFGTNFEGSPEPIYGSVFLPRKFKIAVTVPGDNSVDLFTNDLGIVVLTSPEGELQGYNLVVGGGMGRSHRHVSSASVSFGFCLIKVFLPTQWRICDQTQQQAPISVLC